MRSASPRSPASPTAAPFPPSAAGRRALCLIASAAAFVVFLDATVVNVAFHSMQASFPGISRADLAVTLTAYAAVLGALLPAAGRFGDHVGHRRFFLGSFAVFVAASALCGLSTSVAMLIAARVLQGAAAACMAPSSLAVMLPQFPRDRQTFAVSIWSGAAGVAALVGPALGGVVVESLGWRAIFLVNVPVGVAAVAAGVRLLPPDGLRALRPDLLSACWSALAAGSLTVALFRIATAGWAAPAAWALFGVAAVAVVLCVARGRATGRPLADPGLLADPGMRRANVATLLTSAAGFALMFANMLFLTEVWRYSALELGLAVSPGPVMTALVALPAGRLADRLGVALVAVPGALLLAAGGAWFALRTSADPRWATTWLPGSLMTGVGIGLSFPAIGASAVTPAPAAALGAAIALNGVARQIGAVAGITLVVSLARDAAPAATLGTLHRSWAAVALLAAAGAAALLHPGHTAAARERSRISRQR